MDDITDLIDKADEYCAELQILAQGYMEQVRLLLWGSQSVETISDEEIPTEDLSSLTTQRSKSRIMRLSSHNETDGSNENELIPPPYLPEPLKNSASKLSDHQSSEMFVRPKRAAVLKSAKCLKEPKLNEKLRRPSNFDKVKVKLENEQRRSQMDAKLADRSRENVRSEDSIIVLPTKALSIVELDSKDDMSSETSRKLVAKVKHQEILVAEDPPPAEETKIGSKSVQMPKVSVGNNQLSTEKTMPTLTFTITTKKGKKKKVTHKPIKVERISDVDNGSKTRTCNGRAENSGESVYEDALAHMSPKIANTLPLPSAVATARGINETVTTVQLAGKPPVIGAGAPFNDATFCVNAAQKIVLGNQNANAMEPEKPEIKTNKLLKPQPIGALVELPTSSKVFKKPGCENELFNQLNWKAEGFKNTAKAELSKSGRDKSTKENTAPPTTTPTVGKLAPPTLGSFHTPTQTSNLTQSSMAKVKKGSNSTSKVLAWSKACTTVKHVGGFASAKKVYSENSAKDFRKSLHNLAEERKKQREQKRLLAAQQRENMERERTERLEKLNKEREEKRLKKQQEAQEKKRALEEIQRILKQQDDAAAGAKDSKLKIAKSKGTADQERKLLQQNKTQAATKTLIQLPKMQSKYTFEMLHEDDSTDEEDTASSQRPPPPNWSRKNVRGPAISAQQHWPTKVVDAFFSVQPMSPDLRAIFPKISSRQLNRNSSAVWTTPPPYPELPKY